MIRAKAVMHPVPVVATKSDDGNYRFEPHSDIWDPAEEEFVFDKRKHDMNKIDYHLLEFVLEDKTGEHLRFAPIPHDAMWVGEGGPRSSRKCPDARTDHDYSVMEPICVCDDGTRLIVRNENPRREDWAFTLNFVRNGDDPTNTDRFVSWDPGGANENGGREQ